jgi:hypothetical protein
MTSHFVDPEWLDAVRDMIFFYPAAGSNDFVEPLTVLQNHIAAFWFCDPGYNIDYYAEPVFHRDTGFRSSAQERWGAISGKMETRRNDAGSYNFMTPGWLRETYTHNDGREVIVIRRRGFGQIALSKDFKEQSIGVFMHRNDSAGDGGSKVFFLANKTTRYEPCGQLFRKLASRLTSRALIITDGSNSSIGFLRRFHWKDISGARAFAHHRNREYEFGGFRWSCIGWLSRGNGPTLAWGLSRKSLKSTD